MATLKQKKLAKELANNLKSKNTLTAGQMLEKVGYSKNLVKQPGRVIQAEGVQQELAQLLPDEYLDEAHRELLDQKKIEYFVFPNKMSDEEITDKVNDIGIEIINIQKSARGKYAFYSVIDVTARKAALDMAYKLKGSYAPEKRESVNLNVNVTGKPSPKEEEVVNKANEELRKLYGEKEA